MVALSLAMGQNPSVQGQCCIGPMLFESKSPYEDVRSLPVVGTQSYDTTPAPICHQ